MFYLIILREMLDESLHLGAVNESRGVKYFLYGVIYFLSDAFILSVKVNHRDFHCDIKLDLFFYFLN